MSDMTDGKRQEDATLLDVLIDGFEKNEMLHGFHWRELPMPDEATAVLKFLALSDEARRWKGAPLRTEESGGRRLAAWPDLEIWQANRGVMVRVRAPRFANWWHAPATWAGSPMREVFDWSIDEASKSKG